MVNGFRYLAAIWFPGRVYSKRKWLLEVDTFYLSLYRWILNITVHFLLSVLPAKIHQLFVALNMT